MTTLTQTLRRRQAIVEYSLKHGVSDASTRYNVSRPTIYRWRSRYDGSMGSLQDRSRRPHHHPAQHTDEELKLIGDMRRRNPNAGLVVFWVKLRQRGYTRSISGLYRVLRRGGQERTKLPNPKYTPKPYEQMQYPGQKGQIDVKFVPNSCLTDEAKIDGGFFQYTFIDEYSRFRILWASKEHSTYASAQFLEHVVRRFPFRIECIQTDNGMEFTNALAPKGERNRPTLFEKTLQNYGIKAKRIKPYTPRHNGKVERSHRKDNEYFYASHKFYSFDDFKRQLSVWEYRYNRFPMRPLNWHSPAQTLSAFSSPVTHH